MSNNFNFSKYKMFLDMLEWFMLVISIGYFRIYRLGTIICILYGLDVDTRA